MSRMNRITMTTEHLLSRCIQRAADPQSIYGVNLATRSIMHCVRLRPSGTEVHYRVFVVFDASITDSNDDGRAEKCIANFRNDLNHFIARFRLNVSSIYVDYFNGKPYEIPKSN